MDKSMNALPMLTYVRQRVSTVVVDVGDISSGNIPLTLAKPSDLTFLIVSDVDNYAPALFVAAVNRQPNLYDFDIIVAPTVLSMVKNQDRVTLRLPAGPVTIYWKALAVEGTLEQFGTIGSRLVVAVDQ